MNLRAVDMAASSAYVGGATAGLGWWLSNEGVTVIGVTIAFLSFVVQLVLGVAKARLAREQSLREQREHEARMLEHEARMRQLIGGKE